MFFLIFGKRRKGEMDFRWVNVICGFIGVGVGIVAFLNRNRVRSLAYRWEVECAKMALLPIGYSDRREVGAYTQWGIKVEFGGFIGGFGKIFFTKGGIKRKGMGFLEGRAKLYFF